MRLLRAACTAAMAGWMGIGHAQVQNADDASLADFLRAQRVTALARLDYFQSSRTLDSQKDFLGASLQLKALPRFGAMVDGKLEARLIDSDLRNRAGQIGRSRLLEAFVTVHFHRADLRIGRQIVAWGRADGINPTDNLTPRDYSVLLPFDEDQRFGTTGAKLDIYLPHQLTLTAFTTPFFEPSVFPLPANAALLDKRPARTPSDSAGALKLSSTGADFDWSVSYYHGRNLLPTVLPNPSQFELRYEHSNVFGADAARNFGRFGFRTEMAYSRPDAVGNPDPNAGKSRLFWVGGVDRTLLDNLNINLQVFAHWMPRYHDPAMITPEWVREAALENTIIAGQESRFSSGSTFRISNKWLNDTLQAEIFAAANFKHGDRFLRPLVTYAFNDHLKGTLGGEVYRGGQNTPYGLFKSNSGAFLELRYGL